MKKLKILSLILLSLISLTLFVSCSDNDSSAGSEEVNTNPVANFMVNPESGTVETEFSFDASSSSDAEDENEALEVRFDFDNDGNFETSWNTEKTAIHKYSEVGTYSVKLEVKDSGGLVSEKVKTVIVNEIPNTAPVANFMVNPESGTVETEFSFDASASSDAEDEASVLEVRFDFDGDSQFETDWTTEKTALHKYSEVGNYDIKLEVKDSGGLVSEKVKTVTVNELPNTAPVANFMVNPESGIVDTEFSFDASASSDAEDEASVLEVRWDFDGDNQFDTDWITEKTATYKYDAIGTYMVKLEVKDSGGLVSEKVKTVTVNELPNTAPVADFTVNLESGTIATEFSFDASASSDAEDEASVLKVRFDFDGDNQFETDWTTEKTATYKYPQVGNYSVKLEVKDTGGMISNKAKSVEVVAGGSSVEMALIPAGSFMMGNNKSSIEGGEDEYPVHEVTVNSFKMSKYETTNAEFCEFLNAMGCVEGEYEGETIPWIFIDYDKCRIEENNGLYEVESGYENHPVIWVTWYGAEAYCEWKGGRLPTEAEWEYAARGGLEGKRFPLGETISQATNGDEQACYYAMNAAYSYDVSPTDGYYQEIDDVIVVGSFAANGYGLYDMAGNVFEWCYDWYSFDYYANSPSDNPTGPSTGTQRVLRGGCWYDFANFCRVSVRRTLAPNSGYDSYGFRLVRD